MGLRCTRWQRRVDSAGDAGLRAWGPGSKREGARKVSGWYGWGGPQPGFLPQAIYKLKKACRVEMECERQGQMLTPEEVVDRIFLLLDENGDGNGGQRWGAAHSTAPPGPPPPSHGFLICELWAERRT